MIVCVQISRMSFTPNQAEVVKEILDALMPVVDAKKNLRKSIIKDAWNVIKILAPTGYGKTSVIPMTLVATILQNERMIVLFPNVTAVRKMYAYLKEFEAGINTLKVGFAAASEKNYTKETNLVLATYGHGYRLALTSLHLYNLVVNKGMRRSQVGINTKGLLQFNSVVFDEYHNTAKEIPMVASIYRFFMQTTGREKASTLVHRAFFMTATDIHQLPGGMDSFPDKEKVTIKLGNEQANRYTVSFAEPEDVTLGDPNIHIPILIQMGRVQLRGKELILTRILETVVRVVNQIIGIEDVRPDVSARPEIDETIAVINKVMRSKTKTSRLKLPTEHNGEKIEYNNILVFLPGKREIQYVAEHIKKDNSVEVIQFHSKSPDAITRQLASPPPQGVRRIILATNIVESSVTIDYLDVVIDSLLEKTVEQDLSTGTKRLVLQYISSNSSRQRAGRVGRNRVGAVIKIMSEKDYNNLPTSRPNSIFTEDVSKLVIEIFANYYEGRNNILDEAGIVQSRRREAVDQAAAIKIFSREGNGYRMILTAAQLDLLGKLPMGLTASVFLIDWFKRKYPIYPGIVLAVIWDMNTHFLDTLDHPELAREFISNKNLKHSTLIGESVNLWKYAVENLGTIQMKEHDISRLFTLGSEVIVDAADFKRLSNLILEAVRIFTSHERPRLNSDINNLNTKIERYREEGDKATENELIAEKEVKKSERNKPIPIGNFSTNEAIRGLGYIVSKEMDINRIGEITHIDNNGNATITSKGENYRVPSTISKMMGLKRRQQYLILDTFAIDRGNLKKEKMATNIIPQYSVMDEIIQRGSRGAKPARLNLSESENQEFSEGSYHSEKSEELPPSPPRKQPKKSSRLNLGESEEEESPFSSKTSTKEKSKTSRTSGKQTKKEPSPPPRKSRHRLNLSSSEELSPRPPRRSNQESSADESPVTKRRKKSPPRSTKKTTTTRRTNIRRSNIPEQTNYSDDELEEFSG